MAVDMTMEEQIFMQAMEMFLQVVGMKLSEHLADGKMERWEHLVHAAQSAGNLLPVISAYKAIGGKTEVDAFVDKLRQYELQFVDPSV